MKSMAATKSRTYRRVISVAGTVGVLALAACSSSSSGSSSSTATSSAATTATATSSAATTATATSSAAASGDIVVGGITDGIAPGIAQGFSARIARFNAAGGIDGRKIKLVGVLNDGSSLSANQANVQTLVLKDHVFAVTPYWSQGWSPASSALLEKNSIPYIGWAITPSACVGNGSFPIDGCLGSSSYVSTYNWQLLATTLGKPVSQLKVAVIATDNAGGSFGVAGQSAGIKAAGATVVYGQASIPVGGATDYTPYVQSIISSNPNVVYLLNDFATAAAVTGALRQAGYQGAILNPTGYVPGLLATQKQLALAMQGSLVSVTFPPQEASSAAAKQVLADLKSSGEGTSLSLGNEVGWFSADEFIQELQATAKAGLPLTSENFVKTIHAGFTYNSGAGSLNGITFPAQQTQPGTCEGIMLVKPGGTYSVAAPFSCGTTPPVKLG